MKKDEFKALAMMMLALHREIQCVAQCVSFSLTKEGREALEEYFKENDKAFTNIIDSLKEK